MQQIDCHSRCRRHTLPIAPRLNEQIVAKSINKSPIRIQDVLA